MEPKPGSESAPVPGSLMPGAGSRATGFPVAPRPADGAGLRNVSEARELFWQNVIREMLTSLSVLHAQIRSHAASQAMGIQGPGIPAAPPQQDLFDGRMAVLTLGGQRVAIAEVFPLFACGIGATDAQRTLSMAVECTVFQIRTPSGEVYTLPLHEIRGFHALSEELMARLTNAATHQSQTDDDGHEPFGFAAFSSLSRSNEPSPVDPYYPPPDGGGEPSA